jgi:hypothetical protein|tara:strand:- start:6153 stop:6335 length:183 start_codon:yes stop_codon:yes gene_type:complete
MTIETIVLAALAATTLYQGIKIHQITSAFVELDEVVFDVAEAHNELVTALTKEIADALED